MSQLAERFQATLQELEQKRDVAVMTRLFRDDSELRRAPRARVYQGPDGAAQFWSEYLDAFSNVETRFSAVTEEAGRAVLEWHSVATTKQGRHIEYDGCSVIEGEGEQVTQFRTYYDAEAAGMGAAVPSASARDRQPGASSR